MSVGVKEPEGPDRAPGSFGEWLHAWRYFFWFLALLLVSATFYQEENWRGRWVWEKQKRNLEALGEQLESSAFLPPRVPDSENFAMTPLLAPLFEFTPGTQRWRDTNGLRRVQVFAPSYDVASAKVKPPKGARSNSWVRPGMDLPAWHSAFLEGQTKSTGSTAAQALAATNWTVQQAATGVLAELSEADSVLDELRVASRRRYSRFNINYANENPAGILLPHLAALRHFCVVLQLRASAELALGKTDTVFDDLLLMLHLADAPREEPFLISQLVRKAQFEFALQIIAEGMTQWSDAQLQTIQARLQRFDFCADTKRALRAERAFFGGGMIQFFQDSSNKRALAPFFTSSGSQKDYSFEGALLTAAPAGWLYLEQANYSRLFQNHVLPQIDPVKHRIAPSACQKAEKALNELSNHSGPALVFHHEFLAALLLPSVAGISQKAAFAQTGVSAAALACALERYRRMHGQYPEVLDALGASSLGNLPHDIINGEPLKYKRTADGQYSLYSVGWNETDDGGKVVLMKDGTSADRAQGDWVWRPVGR